MYKFTSYKQTELDYGFTTSWRWCDAGVMRQQIDLLLHKIACNILIQIY